MKASIYNASAGSGKTYRLAYNYVRTIIRDPQSYSHILAVTFTNKATEEMKNRILKELHLLASGKRSRYRADLRKELGLGNAEIEQRAAKGESLILHNYSRFTVLTIDRFFQRILRAFLHELNIDLNYSIELDTDTLLEKSADMLIEEIRTKQDLLAWMVSYAEQRIEENKGWNFKGEITSIGEEILKEEHRESLEQIPPREELKRLLDIINQEYRQLKESLISVAKEGVKIINAEGLSTADFPDGGRGIGQRIINIAGGNLNFTEAQERCLRESAQGVDDRWMKKPKSAAIRPTLQPIVSHLYELYCCYVNAKRTSALVNDTIYRFGVLRDLHQNLKSLCNVEQLMLLSETKNLLAEFITEEDAPFIYEKVGNRYDYYMIDEFQDTSVREWQNFLPLLHEAMSKTEEAVMIVGDIKQSIYRWRGGDWRILHSKAKRALEERGEVCDIPMQENYRSLNRIVEFNNEAIKRVVSYHNDLLNDEVNEALAEGSITPDKADELRNMLASAYATLHQFPIRKNKTKGYISVTHNEKPDLNLLVERICHILTLENAEGKRYSPSDIMILVRLNQEAAQVAEALLAFKSTNTNPLFNFDVMTQEALSIGKAPIAQFITTVMQLSLTPNEKIYRALINQYLERAFDAPLSDEESQLIATLKLYSPQEAFELIVLHYQLNQRTNEIAYLQALHEMILSFCNNRSSDLKSFLDWWEEQGQKQSMSVAKSRQTIEICTIHKAKGLEKKVVIIPFCTWNTMPKDTNRFWGKATSGPLQQFAMPVTYSMTPKTLFAHIHTEQYVYSCIDNVNLLYVAFTRAVEALHIFTSKKGSRKDGSSPKTYIHEAILSALPELVNDSKLEGRFRTETYGDGEEDTPTKELQIWEFGTEEGPAGDDTTTDEAEYLTWPKEERNDPTQEVMNHYPTARPDLVLSLKSERYIEDGEEHDLSPRNFGILMHKVFEQATNREDIHRSIERMKGEGLLSSGDADELARMVDMALTDPTIGEWFDGHWEQVMTEGAILQPKAGLKGDDKLQRRPDRVMIDGKRAVVVDYKFGEKRATQYRAQIRRYGELLHQMGYTEVEGWLWYVKLGKTEKVI